MKRYSIFTCLLVMAGCGGSSPTPETAPAASDLDDPAPPYTEGGEAAAPDTFAEQVELGAQLYAANCAKCHGESGQGTEKAPPVVGLSEGALPLDPPPGAKVRDTQFKTVADIAQFVTEKMPADDPGSLTAEQYWAILAFDLKANGIDLGDQKLDPSLAATLEVPRAQ